ncbi:unnamed protein product [Arabidopsis halleri]
MATILFFAEFEIAYLLSGHRTTDHYCWLMKNFGRWWAIFIMDSNWVIFRYTALLIYVYWV